MENEIMENIEEVTEMATEMVANSGSNIGKNAMWVGAGVLAAGAAYGLAKLCKIGLNKVAKNRSAKATKVMDEDGIKDVIEEEFPIK